MNNTRNYSYRAIYGLFLCVNEKLQNRDHVCTSYTYITKFSGRVRDGNSSSVC